MKNPEKFTPYIKEEAKKIIEEVKETLAKDFGLTEFTQVEFFELQHALQEVMEVYPVKIKPVTAQEKIEYVHSKSVFGSTKLEVIDRWLSRTHHVRIIDVPVRYVLTDQKTDEQFMFNGKDCSSGNNTLKQAWQKKFELQKLGHSGVISGGITEEFKEMLREDSKKREII
ncbi:MAG: hypothetical protein HY225_02250 [Candidatus Vogelbacteria bacterium]|nr:hypothetical protein [Candidatus Vogelbacteria bacterium]